MLFMMEFFAMHVGAYTVKMRAEIFFLLKQMGYVFDKKESQVVKIKRK